MSRFKSAIVDYQLVALINCQSQEEVVYFYYPDEGHDYRDPDSWISFWAVTEHFLKDNLGGKAQPIQKDFELGNKVVVEGAEYIGGL